MNDPEKRICPYCIESINVRAKLCPHCRQWLTWKSFRNPSVMMLTHLGSLMLLWILFGMAIFSVLGDLQNPKPYYSEFPNSLKVLESQMNWAQTPQGLRIYLTGVLTNTSAETWREVEFDCRFFDAHHEMLDADAGRGYFTILPGDDAAFRVAILPVAPTNDYASFKISVGNARNPNGLF